MLNVHTRMSLRVACGWPAEGTARIRGCTDVRPRVVHGSPAGDVYLSTDLYCTRKLALGDHTLIYVLLKSGCHIEFFLFG